MTKHFTTRLLPFAIAGVLVAGCAAHQETASEADEIAANVVREASEFAAPVPPAPPAPVALMAPGTVFPASTTLDSVVGGERALGRVDAESVAIGKAATGAAARQGQSGTLTAGDYDDLLNSGQYARYAGRYLQDHGHAGLPFVDTRTPLKIRVLGKDGLPLAFADVSATDRRGKAVHVPTAANGIAVLFPGLDQLPPRVHFEVAAQGTASIERTVELRRLGPDRTITIALPIAGRAPQALDLLLAIDTTGSMTDELSYLQVELDSIVASLRRIRPGTDIRVGLLVYRDEGDEYVTRRFEFTADLVSLRRQLGAQQANGGGDYPEAVDRAFADANGFDWRDDATKVMLHVADAPPHAERTSATWQQALALRTRGVHIVPVAASGVAEDAQYLMRSMAALTQSRYLFLTDDSGVGLAHDEPDVPCYVVTPLDGLIERVVASLMLGQRIEPRADAVLRRTGDYDRGVCRTTRRPRIAE